MNAQKKRWVSAHTFLDDLAKTEDDSDVGWDGYIPSHAAPPLNETGRLMSERGNS
jgi:hypothetical protein